ncbi:MAG TPA: DUF4340 domain-containing protein [Opitutaceae bacterium]|nr:DUF4340 domain-containing protein [Opitutaceae bacterium]
MKLKTLASVVAVLAVLSAIAWYLRRPPPPPAVDPRVGQPVLDGQVLAAAASVRLTDQGKTVLLARQPDGKWRDTSYYDLPVDFDKLGHFTDDLTAAKVQRLVSRSPEVLARLGFKDTSIALLDAAGKEQWRVTLGKEAESGGRFVKFGDESKGYLANLTTFLDSDPKNWADSLLLDLKPDDIAALSVGFDTGAPVVAVRAKKEDAWAAQTTPAGKRVDGEKITSLLSSLTSLRFQDTAALDAPEVVAAREHGRTVTLTTFDKKTFTIQLGRRPELKKPAKPEVSGQGSEVSPQKPEGGAGTVAASTSAPPNPEPKTLNPEPAATQPAGPVYAFVTSSDPAAPVNALMKKRAFQVYDWNFTSLPQKPDELFEALPAPPPAADTEAKPAVGTKPEAPAAETKPTEPAKP